ncbi:MAG: ribosome biogenesis GTP-binding protein YihA/YsxC [Byssovorax sp.]
MNKAGTESSRRGPSPQGKPAGKPQGKASAKPQGKPQAKPASDPLRIVDARFLAGAGPGSALPAPTQAEIAFGGRSNVGKSSLINCLVERKNLVRTSSTPGSTRQLNLYEARAADGTVLHLVDLPGYGFTAHRSKSEKAAWGNLIEGYLKERATLAAVVLLVDVRRGIEEDDRELLEFLDTIEHPSRRPIEVLIVGTKLDKVPKSAQKTALTALAASAGRRVIGFSSETAQGRTELHRALRRASLGQVIAPTDAPPAEVSPAGESPAAGAADSPDRPGAPGRPGGSSDAAPADQNG